jgi:hypothetical protein
VLAPPPPSPHEAGALSPPGELLLGEATENQQQGHAGDCKYGRIGVERFDRGTSFSGQDRRRVAVTPWGLDPILSPQVTGPNAEERAAG